jgi:hypothetical protein
MSIQNVERREIKMRKVLTYTYKVISTETEEERVPLYVFLEKDWIHSDERPEECLFCSVLTKTKKRTPLRHESGEPYEVYGVNYTNIYKYNCPPEDKMEAKLEGDFCTRGRELSARG